MTKRRNDDRDRGTLLRRAAETARRKVAQPIDPAVTARVGERMLQADRARREMLIRNSYLTRRTEVVEWLTEASAGERFRSVPRMLKAAEAAVGLADALPSADVGAEILSDVRSRAWLSLANAQRVAGDLAASARSFGRASELGRRGSRPELFLAELLMVRAPLLRLRGRNGEALADCLSSHAAFDALGEAHLAGRALICAAAVHYTDGDHRRAIELSAAGLRQIEPSREPSLVVTASHNIAAALIEVGEPEEGLKTFHTIHPAYRELQLDRPVLKVRYLEAKALLEVGLRREAYRRLEQARSAALAAGRDSLVDKIQELWSVASASPGGPTAEVRRLRIVPDPSPPTGAR